MQSINNPRYLTKSRFKLALECPTKLFYTQKEEIFHQKHLLRGDYLIGHSWRYGSKDFIGEWIHIGVNLRFQGWDEVLQ